LPGSPEKIAVLEERARRGVSLWHPHDAKPDDFRAVTPLRQDKRAGLRPLTNPTALAILAFLRASPQPVNMTFIAKRFCLACRQRALYFLGKLLKRGLIERIEGKLYQAVEGKNALAS